MAAGMQRATAGTQAVRNDSCGPGICAASQRLQSYCNPPTSNVFGIERHRLHFNLQSRTSGIHSPSPHAVFFGENTSARVFTGFREFMDRHQKEK